MSNLSVTVNAFYEVPHLFIAKREEHRMSEKAGHNIISLQLTRSL